jgi:hypothetical protein
MTASALCDGLALSKIPWSASKIARFLGKQQQSTLTAYQIRLTIYRQELSTDHTGTLGLERLMALIDGMTFFLKTGHSDPFGLHPGGPKVRDPGVAHSFQGALDFFSAMG